MHKKEFILAVNYAFGSGGMFCTLTDAELSNYLMTKVMAFMIGLINSSWARRTARRLSTYICDQI